MDIPAPVPLGLAPAMAILVAPGQQAFLQEAVRLGRCPVLVHELGGEKERSVAGPRELLERTRDRLAKMEGTATIEKWGAGARVATVEDASHFAIAGFTWFTLELAHSLDSRAATMSLEELDATIVALEDQGAYRAGWHEAYLERELEPVLGVRMRISDEALARAAVKFGPALALAAEMDGAIRSCWHGRGDVPDLAISFGASSPAMTPEEMLFVSTEVRTRLSGVPAVAPALGSHCEPGNETADAAALSASLEGLNAAAGASGLMLPSRASEVPGVERARVLDATEAGRLAALAELAGRAPAQFREWLNAASLAFPIARAGWPITLSEEEARFLPQVEDGELVPMFIESIPGRQLLLSTWQHVRESELGARVFAV